MGVVGVRGIGWLGRVMVTGGLVGVRICLVMGGLVLGLGIWGLGCCLRGWGGIVRGGGGRYFLYRSFDFRDVGFKGI